MTWRNDSSRTGTTAHKAFQRAVLARDSICRCPGCPRCHGALCSRAATQADHIVPHAEGGTDDPANGQGMCEPCHRHKSAREGVRHQPRRRRPQAKHPGLVDPPGG